VPKRARRGLVPVDPCEHRGIESAGPAPTMRIATYNINGLNARGPVL